MESRLRHQLDLRLVATAASTKASSNEISAPIDGSGICSSIDDDDGNGNDVSAMHRTEKLSCVGRMTSFNRTNHRTVEISATHKIGLGGSWVTRRLMRNRMANSNNSKPNDELRPLSAAGCRLRQLHSAPSIIYRFNKII